MVCDLCNIAIQGQPATLLSTKEVVTSKDCWVLYLRSLLAEKVMPASAIKQNITGLVAQMASSDTPWALCEICKTELVKARFPLQLDKSRRLLPIGHALCRANANMQFVMLDEPSIANRF
jgi:hypothetical protein